jgi:GTP-binding protein
MKIKYLKSATQPKEYPFPYRPEVAFVGRSNAGKSSFINALVNQKIAKVSATPGKTRLLNFFDIGDSVYLVDMPGYGFAKGNQREVESWKLMIESYLQERETLKGVLLIMDIRRKWSEQEEMLREWFDHHGQRWGVILNKTDKVSKSAAIGARKLLEKKLGVPVFAVSSSKKEGITDIKKLIFKEWCK